MNYLPLRLEVSFVASQRQRLVEVYSQLSAAIDREQSEDRAVDSAAELQANETEDRAQDLEITENNRLNVDTLFGRRVSVERAIARIDAGSYGYSELSGDPIPLAQLRLFPDATRTVAEEARRGAEAGG
jgi:DnaK suppressor protein